MINVELAEEEDDDEDDEHPEIARPAAATAASTINLRDMFSLPKVTTRGESPDAIGDQDYGDEKGPCLAFLVANR